MRYTSVRPDDTHLREAMKKVAAERRCFGYRRIHVMLQRQDIHINHKKLLGLLSRGEAAGAQMCSWHQTPYVIAEQD